MDFASVAVKSAWLSKINWTVIIGSLSALATLAGYTVPDDVVKAVTAALVAVTAVVVIVLKSFFTNTVTPASAVKA